MKKLLAMFCVLAIGLASANQANAAFVLSIDPATLTFNGAGVHTINMQITHIADSGPSTISGYTMRFGSLADASQGVMPTGVVSLSATNTLGVGELFSLDPTTNQVAAATFFGADTDIGNGQTQTLFSMDLQLDDLPSYVIGVDFRDANRGTVLTFVDASAEFFDPNSPTTDFSFTLTNSVTAIPEPGSFLALACLGAGGAWYRRRQGAQPQA